MTHVNMKPIKPENYAQHRHKRYSGALQGCMSTYMVKRSSSK